MLLGYCGDNYYGSQYNEHHDTYPTRPTIEGELFQALGKSKLISTLNAQEFKKNHFQRTTRTDKGVHATGNLISMKLSTTGHDELSIRETINKHLPQDIKVWQIQRVNQNFNARKACGSRKYEYIIPTYNLELGIDKLNIILEANMIKSFDKDDLDIIRKYPTLSIKEQPSLMVSIKDYLQTTHNQLVSLRLSEERWNQFRTVLKMFMGTHNFHNYSSQNKLNSSKAYNQRHIVSIDITKPYQIHGHPGEWISIILEGQSFLLHQIRKMVSMSIMCMVRGFPVSSITKSFEPESLSIPKSPSFSLILQETMFTSYNKKLQHIGYDPISFDKCQNLVKTFKENHILNRIIQAEAKDMEFVKFLHYICYSQCLNENNGKQIS